MSGENEILSVGLLVVETRPELQFSSVFAQEFEKLAMILHPQHPLLQPLFKALSRARCLVVFEIKIVIPPSVSLGRRGVRSERLMNHARY